MIVSSDWRDDAIVICGTALSAAARSTHSRRDMLLVAADRTRVADICQRIRRSAARVGAS